MLVWGRIFWVCRGQRCSIKEKENSACRNQYWLIRLIWMGRLTIARQSSAFLQGRAAVDNHAGCLGQDSPLPLQTGTMGDVQAGHVFFGSWCDASRSCHVDNIEQAACEEWSCLTSRSGLLWLFRSFELSYRLSWLIWYICLRGYGITNAIHFVHCFGKICACLVHARTKCHANAPSSMSSFSSAAQQQYLQNSSAPWMGHLISNPSIAA